MLRAPVLQLLIGSAAAQGRTRISLASVGNLPIPDPNDANSHQLCADWFNDCSVNPDCVGSATDNRGCPEDLMRKAPQDLLMRCYPGVSGYCTHEYCCKNGAFQDPHLAFANGGRADFRGRNGMFYNFLSAPDLAVNVKIEDAKFLLANTMSAEKKVTVDGSFITEVHIVARVGGAKRKFANISFWASELNDQNWGWKTVNGTCGGNFFQIGKKASKQCEELTFAMKSSSGNATVGDWVIWIKGSPVYDRISGPQHRLDLGFHSIGDVAARSRPHGLIGQSYSSPLPRNGKTDNYPAEGYFKTSAMAEGAIDGQAENYEVTSAYATHFTFSRFDEPIEKVPVKSLALGGDAASVERV